MISPLKVGCEGYIAFITEDMWSKGVEEIPVVCEFPYVFPDEIPGLPPVREIDFTIELVPGKTDFKGSLSDGSGKVEGVEDSVVEVSRQGIHQA